VSTAKDGIASTSGRRSLRGNRDFVLLWTAGVASGLGSQLTLVAYPLLVLALNGTATQAGLLGTAGLVTRTVLRLPAGALVDRWDRRRVMLWCDSIRVAALLVVVAAVATGAATLGLLVVAVVMESAGGVFFLPAERAALRSVVPVEHLSSALTINQAREFAAELAGPPLGGVLLGLGRALPFLGDAVSYAYSFVAVLLVRTPLRVARDPDRPTGLLREVTDGVTFTWRNPLLRAIALCVAGSNTVYTGLSFAVIVVAHRSGASPADIGLMLAAAGVGGLLGALLAPRLIAALPPGALVLGVLWIGAILIPAMAAHPTPALIGPLLAGFTALIPASNAVLISRQMATTPEDMQGRVFTSMLFLSGAGGAVMPVLTGALLGVAGSKTVLLALGGAMAIVAGLSTANRGLRTVDR
jgi:predicted MFS family arabinose efflux permease